jgi:hypothetical protein
MFSDTLKPQLLTACAAAALFGISGLCTAATVPAGSTAVVASPAASSSTADGAAAGEAVNDLLNKPSSSAGDSVVSLDDAGGDTLGSAMSVFIQSTFSTDYITPRGLHVSNKGVTWQPLTVINMDVYSGKGLISDVTAYGGIWQDWNTQQHIKPDGSFQEIDPFVGVKTTIAKAFTLDFQYVDFISPNGSYTTEQNLSLKLSYHDTFLKDFSFNPYINPFYEVTGSSTVVTGRNGGTFDVEVGMVPTYTLKAIKDYPITITFPTWFTVGPKNFWDATGQTKNNFGVLSSGLQLAIPLSFIPKKFGAWTAFTGFQYYNELNNNLMTASHILGTGGHRNIYVGTAGVNVFF